MEKNLPIFSLKIADKTYNNFVITAFILLTSSICLSQEVINYGEHLWGEYEFNSDMTFGEGGGPAGGRVDVMVLAFSNASSVPFQLTHNYSVREEMQLVPYSEVGTIQDGPEENLYFVYFEGSDERQILQFLEDENGYHLVIDESEYFSLSEVEEEEIVEKALQDSLVNYKWEFDFSGKCYENKDNYREVLKIIDYGIESFIGAIEVFNEGYMDEPAYLSYSYLSSGNGAYGTSLEISFWKKNYEEFNYNRITIYKQDEKIIINGVEYKKLESCY